VFVKGLTQVAVAILVLESEEALTQASKLSLAFWETCVMQGQQTPG